MGDRSLLQARGTTNTMKNNMTTDAAKKARHVLSFIRFQDAYGAHLNNKGTNAEDARLSRVAGEIDAAREADGFTIEDMMEGDRLAMEQRLPSAI
jgi:hypothetical protein